MTSRRQTLARSALTRSAIALGLLLAVYSTVRSASPPPLPPSHFTPAFSAADLDLEHCESFGDGKVQAKPTPAALEALLGLAPWPATTPVWSTGQLNGEFRHFRIAFNRPVQIGTLCTNYSNADAAVWLLKPDAPFPGDLTDDAQWTRLSDLAVKTLAPGTTTRALRFTHRSINNAWERHTRESTMGMMLAIKERAYDPVEISAAPTWASVKADVTWTANWPVELPIAGIALLPSRSVSPLASSLDTGVEIHPSLAASNQWKVQSLIGESGRLGVLDFISDFKTRALRLSAKDLRTPKGHSTEPLILPLVLLADNQTAPESFLPPAPFTFPYKMPLDGFAAIRIKNAQGEPIRRLIAEVPRKTGEVQEAWDLKDDSGRYVAPGKYEWYGMARKPLRLTYEGTVYNSGKPPWLAPVPSLGWWMADHCPPETVCAVGNKVFMGDFGAEFGVGIIATDLDGTKVWHDAMGAPRILSDGQFAYVVSNESVTRIDPEHGFKKDLIHQFQYNAATPPHNFTYDYTDRSGAAIFGAKLYVSYNAPAAPWVRPAIGADNIDRANSYPRVLENIKVHDTDYSPAERMLSAFLSITSSNVAGWDGADPKGSKAHTMILRLGHSVPIGSLVLPPGDITVYALHDDEKLPAWLVPQGPGTPMEKADDQFDTGGELDDRFDPKQWTRLSGKPVAGRPSIAIPAEGLYTNTIVFTGPNLTNLPYAIPLDRRYRDATPAATLIPCEGQITPTGGWVANRQASRPISPADPCIAGLVWNKPTNLRGFALIGPMKFAGTSVDVWDGPADAVIDAVALRKNENWRTVMTQQQNRNDMKMSWHSPRILLGDIGETQPVRALRIRVTESPTKDQSPTGGFDSFVALEPLGGDVAIRPDLSQRITIVDLPGANQTKATAVHHVAIKAPGMMTFDAAGNLFIVSDRNILRIEAGDVSKTPLMGRILVPREKCPLPRGMVIDSDGQLYVIDASLFAVRVFDSKTGDQLRIIGTPGGSVVGPYDPTRLTNPTNLTIDANGKLWIVEAAFQPKRISRWSRDGTFEKDFMGPTQYGGGGMIDPHDPSIINHLGMKFRLDFATRTWKLESRLAKIYERNLCAPDRVVYFKDHRYLVGDGNLLLNQGFGRLFVIGVENGGVNQPMIVAGMLRDWQSFGDNAASLAALADHDPSKTSFIWCDLNRDGKPTPDEVQIIDSDAFANPSAIGDDLSLNFCAQGSGWRIRPASIRADGLPLYDVKQLQSVEGLDRRSEVDADGWTLVCGERMINPAGKIAWTYPDNYALVQSSYKVPWGFYGRPPGTLAGTLNTMGTFTVAGEPLYAVNANQGEFFLFTRDGLFIGTVFGGPRGYGRRFFSMPECEPGKTDLTDLRRTVEDFNGHITATPDGKVYAIAGKNHITLVRVDGLDTLPRMNGTIEVKPEDLATTEAWETRSAHIRVAMQQPVIARVPAMPKPPKIDGDVVSDWPLTDSVTIRNEHDDLGHLIANYTAKLGFDPDNLYVGAIATSSRPMTNRGQAARDLFLTGDAVDINLALNPDSPANRDTPAIGDIRILITQTEGKPRVILFRPLTGGRSLGGIPMTYTSPVGENKIEEIVEIKDAKVAITFDGSSYHVEASIPWKSLGATAPKSKINLRGDLGILEGDPNGQMTVGRYYWSNKTHVVLSDQPSESRLHPDLWGELRFDDPAENSFDMSPAGTE